MPLHFVRALFRFITVALAAYQTSAQDMGAEFISRKYFFHTSPTVTSNRLAGLLEKEGLKIPREDWFLNDRVNELTIRAQRKEFPAIERLVAPFIKRPQMITLPEMADVPGVSIESRFLEFSGELPFEVESKLNGSTNVVRGVLTEGEAVRALELIQKLNGVDLITIPPVFTTSGRQARLQLETTRPLSPQSPPPRPRSAGPGSDPTPLGNPRPGR